MSLELSRRLFTPAQGKPLGALQHWRGLHPDSELRAEPLGSGWMLYWGPDIPWSGTIGLGLDGPIAPDLFDELDAFYAPRGVSPSMLVSPYAHPTLIEGMGRRGFVVEHFRQVMVRPPGRVEAPEHVRGVPSSGGVIARGFHEGQTPTELHLRMERIYDVQPNYDTYGAFEGETCVGAGRLGVGDGIGLFYGTSVLPEARQRGHHDALLRARINAATEAGCDLLVIEGIVGGGTERNARRLGFRVAFSTASFRRPS